VGRAEASGACTVAAGGAGSGGGGGIPVTMTGTAQFALKILFFEVLGWTSAAACIGSGLKEKVVEGVSVGAASAVGSSALASCAFVCAFQYVNCDVLNDLLARLSLQPKNYFHIQCPRRMIN
jgi:hypothetical protein